jgi:KDO2-lipid IV(A) lauroyltransferase
MNSQLFLRKLGILIVKLLPLKIMDDIAVMLGILFYNLLRKPRSYIETNLRHIFHEDRLDPEQFNRYVKNTFVNYARAMTDFLRLSYITRDGFSVADSGCDRIGEALRLKRGCVLLSLHIGNWDYGGAYLAARGLPVTALVEEIDPAMLSLYTKHRERTGLRTFPVSKAAYAFINAIKSNRALAILADRDILGNGVPVRFFSGRRKIPRGLGEIIIKKNMPVLYSYMIFDESKKWRYRCIIEPPVFFSGSVEEFNTHMVKKLEEIIKRYPDQWMVFHPEWVT